MQNADAAAILACAKPCGALARQRLAQAEGGSIQLPRVERKRFASIQQERAAQIAGEQTRQEFRKDPCNGSQPLRLQRAPNAGEGRCQVVLQKAGDISNRRVLDRALQYMRHKEAAALEFRKRGLERLSAGN